MQSRRSSAAIKIQTTYRILLAKKTRDVHILMKCMSPDLLNSLIESYDSDEDEFDRCPHGVCLSFGCIQCAL